MKITRVIEVKVNQKVVPQVKKKISFNGGETIAV